jgi:hypothetical protein
MERVFLLFSVWLILFSGSINDDIPNLNSKEDLIKLGMGKIVEKDNCVITRIFLEEVREFGITYRKDDSLHDIAIDDINRLEFKNSKWGPIKIKFSKNGPLISALN